VEAGLMPNPRRLTARLDWARTFKTPYEVACLEEATAKSARGHRAAEAAFRQGASELDIHHAYVQAVGCTDADLPYGSIVALDEKGAILHYEGKRPHVRQGTVLLIDAGASHLGYASDITRTWTAPRCDPRFRALHEGLERVQLELCDLVQPGLHFPAFHELAHYKLAELLVEHGLLRAVPEEAVAEGWTRPFFPCGLGHHLGLQVHDVAGRQLDAEGTPAPQPPRHPFLRTTHTLAEGHVVTVEPGIYFIPMLLRPFLGNPAFDWDLIEALAPLGGVRVEDDLLVTAGGHRNLTREHLPERAGAAALEGAAF
jgi:Xaa-Pro dipeptidase